MSDADQEYKPKIRPQSTMAQAFSTALDSAFSLDSEVDHLSQTIDQKKFQMIIQNRELEELQARIREAEERLKSRGSVLLERKPSDAHGDGGYQSTESASSTTSPTDTTGQYPMGGQYPSGDEHRRPGDNRQQGRDS
ncbi:hypothetical protein BJX68DRAFT_124860 [Aspergillus pseudodeflectus]|uniref:Uncharacterized protein n=1 Tax=Aspergillus pseudodeflectus TaxID=176178 RepID=A0ABR4K2Y3_9EURO